MTIRSGEPWGTLGPVPTDIRRVHSDAEIREIVVAARNASTDPPTLALLGGDLMRAVGGTGDESRLLGEVPLLPIDVVRIEAGDRTSWFVAHAIARRSWWRGEVVGAINAQFVGNWDVAPRGHPNDGRVDLVRVASAMSVRDRWGARSRLVHGTHVPHPEIEIRQVATATVQLPRAARLWLDGRPWGSARTFTVTVEPDALLVCV